MALSNTTGNTNNETFIEKDLLEDYLGPSRAQGLPENHSTDCHILYHTHKWNNWECLHMYCDLQKPIYANCHELLLIQFSHFLMFSH